VVVLDFSATTGSRKHFQRSLDTPENASDISFPMHGDNLKRGSFGPVNDGAIGIAGDLAAEVHRARSHGRALATVALDRHARISADKAWLFLNWEPRHGHLENYILQ
jgi:hypothetical protein